MLDLFESLLNPINPDSGVYSMNSIDSEDNPYFDDVDGESKRKFNFATEIDTPCDDNSFQNPKKRARLHTHNEKIQGISRDLFYKYN